MNISKGGKKKKTNRQKKTTTTKSKVKKKMNKKAGTRTWLTASWVAGVLACDSEP